MQNPAVRRFVIVIFVLGLLSLACGMPAGTLSSSLSRVSGAVAQTNSSTTTTGAAAAPAITSLDQITDKEPVQLTYGEWNDCMYIIVRGTAIMFNQASTFVDAAGNKISMGTLVRSPGHDALDTGQKRYVSGFWHKVDGSIFVYEKLEAIK